MLQLKTFIKGSIEELKEKVSWPPFGELQNSSVLVLVGCLIFAVVIGLIDLGFQELMNLFYGVGA
ncbi:MAG: preprotein translocase subunit SecE [Cytophagales bacterium]|nr:preprotein translocase subunit SecE [Cytophagales bacterium]